MTRDIRTTAIEPTGSAHLEAKVHSGFCSVACAKEFLDRVVVMALDQILYQLPKQPSVSSAPDSSISPTEKQKQGRTDLMAHGMGSGRSVGGHVNHGIG